MWPLNRPARDVLRPPGATSIPWAVFDADWYRESYPGATAHLAGAPAEAVLAFYFESGQQLGHSPNMLFDEAWHRRTYPGIAALVEAGQFPSAFDAWCRGGCCERSPHWLFDELEYRRRNPDLTDAFLSRNGLVNGYDHYLWRGNVEGRIGHPLFDPAVYRAGLDPAAADEAAADGPFWHCLRRLHRRQPEVLVSPRFDPVWYLDRYPAVRQAIADGSWRWAIEHYLCNDTPTEFDPLPAFSEAYYLALHADAAGMVRRGEIRNGYAHFLRHGVPEGSRSPSEPIDLVWYAAQETVRRDLDRGLAEDAFVHWLTIGQPGGSPSAPPAEALITEAQARTLFRRRARTLSVLHARTRLHFETSGAPALSVIMVLHNQFELTMMALGSLRANYAGDIDLVLIDSGSTDETRDIQGYVRGAAHFRFDTNIGFLLGCNAALQFATGETVLYLNNDTELAPGAIEAALRRLDSDPRIGAVGGMIVRTHGLVQEAGNIIYCDGSTLGYGRDASPLAPEVNFARDVEYCSGVFLMARRSLLHELEGFDEAFAPAYYEDADLCLRMWQAGYRVVYDPAVIVHHLEYGSAVSSRASESEIGRARQIFAEKHAVYLAGRPPRDARRQVFDRMADTTRKRVLFVEDTVPLRMIGSGFVRSNDIVREMAALGYAVTVYPLNGCPFDVASVYADMPDGVEVMHDSTVHQLPEFLTLRRDYYDVIWVARTHNLATVRAALDQVALEQATPERVMPEQVTLEQVTPRLVTPEHTTPEQVTSEQVTLEQLAPEQLRLEQLALEQLTGASRPPPSVVLDTEAIASLREAGQAALEGRAFDLEAAVRAEFRDAAFCAKIVAINDTEAALLRDLEFPRVVVIGHMRVPRPTPRPFARRAGMLFVGAIHLMDSPNYDSLCWFVDEVLPLIERELTWETRLTVAGYTGTDVSLDRFRDHPRVTLRGTVSDLEPLYDSHRVFVAPTRIAAGTPYKVHEAASFGLPVVATGLLRRQLGWDDGRELLAAEASDPATFARHVVEAQRNEALWQRLRDAALDRLRRENNREDYAAAIRGVLGPGLTGN
jgi:GT2 family glycosyltransferase